ncbi:TPA: DUF2635 domain-containing protein [Citrobacter amalonaticus]
MKKLIKPRDGLQVRRPDGGVLKPEGEELEFSAWWERRRREGDITVANVAKPEAKRQKQEGDK